MLSNNNVKNNKKQKIRIKYFLILLLLLISLGGIIFYASKNELLIAEGRKLLESLRVYTQEIPSISIDGYDKITFKNL